MIIYQSSVFFLCKSTFDTVLIMILYVHCAEMQYFTFTLKDLSPSSITGNWMSDHVSVIS